MLRLQWHSRLSNLEAGDSALTVIVIRNDRLTNHGTAAAGMHGDIGALGKLAYEAGISLSKIDPDIPADGSHASNVETIARAKRQKQSDCIVLPGIAVYKDPRRIPNHATFGVLTVCSVHHIWDPA